MQQQCRTTIPTDRKPQSNYNTRRTFVFNQNDTETKIWKRKIKQTKPNITGKMESSSSYNARFAKYWKSLNYQRSLD